MTAPLSSYRALDDSHDNTTYTTPSIAGTIWTPRGSTGLAAGEPTAGATFKRKALDYDSYCMTTGINWPTKIPSSIPTRTPWPTSEKRHSLCLGPQLALLPSRRSSDQNLTGPPSPSITIHHHPSQSNPTTSCWLGWLAASVALH